MQQSVIDNYNKHLIQIKVNLYLSGSISLSLFIRVSLSLSLTLRVSSFLFLSLSESLFLKVSLLSFLTLTVFISVTKSLSLSESLSKFLIISLLFHLFLSVSHFRVSLSQLSESLIFIFWLSVSVPAGFLFYYQYITLTLSFKRSVYLFLVCISQTFSLSLWFLGVSFALKTLTRKREKFYVSQWLCLSQCLYFYLVTQGRSHQYGWYGFNLTTFFKWVNKFY